MYVEYSNIENNQEREKKGHEPYWDSFGGRINAGRDYILFGYLSQGVRYDTDKGFEARGLPNNLGYYALADSRLYIVDNDKDSFEGSVKRATALDWNQRLGCKLTYHDDVAVYVDHPDWHSHSWLTTKEFEKAIKLCEKDKNSWGPVGMKYKALLAAMKSFERTKKYEARLVFWFDN